MKSKKSALSFLLHPIYSFVFLWKAFFSFFSFSFFLLIYFFLKCFSLFFFLFPKNIRRNIQKGLYRFMQSILGNTQKNQNTITRLNLVDLSVKMILMRKTRSLVTVLGMAIGIGSIVFLLSIGYGVQELVISRVAHLEEMKQIEVTTQAGRGIFLDEKALSEFSEIENVANTLPLISVVGKVQFEGSSTDVVTYGVTKDYLAKSAQQPIRGKIFESSFVQNTKNQFQEEMDSPDIESMAQAISSQEEIAVNWETLEAIEENTDMPQAKVRLSSQAKKEAVVSQSFLSLLNLSLEEAVGKTFEVSFAYVFRENSSSGLEGKIETEKDRYTIIGVLPEKETSFFFIPFEDVRSLGITEYDQVKIILDQESQLERVRKLIEAKGFDTVSVADTVEKIDSLFTTARFVLVILGIVALCVASLGMFNTLTVSLLERTREVGLMKAMGMRSSEVKDLFLTESMVMGFVGGLCGLFFGYLAGEMLNIFLSAFAFTKKAEIIDVTHIPILFIVSIVLLSFFVGIITGVYPAKRATRISPLNAMRYE
ncbi:MAG: FtsX-like permease family protein [Candidatus Moranbacteria bacterium]|nr:FtsX-like permease family protein [Candidatus Moranbacteria bacterium]